jgi:hypothetical protein
LVLFFIFTCMTNSALAQVVDDSDDQETTLSKLRTLFSEGELEGTDPDSSQPDYALNQVREIGPAAVPMLQELLGQKSPMARLNAVSALEKLGPEAKPALSDLIRMLDDPVPQIQAKACDALGEIGMESTSAIPSLAKMLNKTEDLKSRFLGCTWRVSDHAKDALIAIGEESVQVFIKRVHDKNPLVRSNAIQALSHFSKFTVNCPATWPEFPDNDEGDSQKRPATGLFSRDVQLMNCVSALTEALDDPELIVRIDAVQGLRSFGPKAIAAVPRLSQHLTDTESYGRGTCVFGTSYIQDDIAKALVAIGPTEKVLSKLAIRLHTKLPIEESPDAGFMPTPRSRFYVALAIAKLGPKAKPIEHFLVTALDDPLTRFGAAIALLQIDPNHARAREIVLASLSEGGIESALAFQTIRRLDWNDDSTRTAVKLALGSSEITARLMAECWLIDDAPRSQTFQNFFLATLNSSSTVDRGFGRGNINKA